MESGSGQAFADELWGIIGEELSSLQEKNRFMRSLFLGELEREQMKLWAKQLFLLTRTGPRFLSAIHSNCEEFEAASWLVRNLYEEYGEGEDGRDHPSLCRNFGKALGMSAQELEAGPELDATRRFIAYAFDVTRNRHWVESLAAIGVALEGVSAKGGPMLSAALRQHYGFAEREIEFFTAHSDLDVDHSAHTMELVARYASTPEIRERVKATVREMTGKTLEWAIDVGELCLAGLVPERSVA